MLSSTIVFGPIWKAEFTSEDCADRGNESGRNPVGMVFQRRRGGESEGEKGRRTRRASIGRSVLFVPTGRSVRGTMRWITGTCVLSISLLVFSTFFRIQLYHVFLWYALSLDDWKGIFRAGVFHWTLDTSSILNRRNSGADFSATIDNDRNKDEVKRVAKRERLV